MLKKQLNSRGSILQIVLIIFLVMLTIITICTSLVISKTKSYKDIDILMKQKNIEIMLMRFYIDSIENDILISDSIDEEDYSIKYYVDDMGSYYFITTSIDIEYIQYQLNVEIEKENLDVKKIEYVEG